MKKAYFISDLHRFARYSRAERYLAEIESAAAEADTFIFGGDIFDFSLAKKSTLRPMMDRSIGWLDKLVSRSPNCRFYYVLGNHDCYTRFVRLLDEFSRTATNFSWHEYYLRLGSCVFVHGDVAERRMTPDDLARTRRPWLSVTKRKTLPGLIFAVTKPINLHPLIHYASFPKRFAARRILAYLDHLGHGPATGITDVYFGHTHLGVSCYRHNGVAFHNGGSPMMGFEFRIVEIEDPSRLE
jgi:UDP-2,3-diacylglucosamine hydrolase